MRDRDRYRYSSHCVALSASNVAFGGGRSGSAAATIRLDEPLGSFSTTYTVTVPAGTFCAAPPTSAAPTSAPTSAAPTAPPTTAPPTSAAPTAAPTSAAPTALPTSADSTTAALAAAPAVAQTAVAVGASNNTTLRGDADSNDAARHETPAAAPPAPSLRPAAAAAAAAAAVAAVVETSRAIRWSAFRLLAIVPTKTTVRDGYTVLSAWQARLLMVCWIPTPSLL